MIRAFQLTSNLLDACQPATGKKDNVVNHLRQLQGAHMPRWCRLIVRGNRSSERDLNLDLRSLNAYSDLKLESSSPLPQTLRNAFSEQSRRFVFKHSIVYI